MATPNVEMVCNAIRFEKYLAKLAAQKAAAKARQEAREASICAAKEEK